MKNSTKNTLKSVAALSAIAVICVALLAIANACIPKYRPKLDLATVELIKEVYSYDVGAQEALDGKYFSMGVIAEKVLADFNKENRAEANNAVLAVYKALKGDNVGALIVEAQAQGYSGNEPIKLLTAIGKDGKILAVTLKSQNENSPGSKPIYEKAYFDKFASWAVGKASVSAADITASTGATSSYSIGGVANATKISLKIANEIIGGKLKADFGEGK